MGDAAKKSVHAVSRPAADGSAWLRALNALPDAVIVTARDALERYEIPERGTRGHTTCALRPDTEGRVAEILALATQAHLPLVISAGRTGLVEAQCPQGEGVLSLERLKRPLRFVLGDGQSVELPEQGDVANALYAWWAGQSRPALGGALLEVDAGIAIDAVNALVEPLGLIWPMEMGSSSAATAGACVANASAGANAVCYGTAAHLCEAAMGFWADATPAGPFRGPVWTTPAPDGLVIDSTQVDPERGLIGSQGLFGVITRLRLRLQPRPAAREGVLIPVPDMLTAAALLPAAQSAFPGDVEEFEFIGRGALEMVLEHLGASVALPFDRSRMQDWAILLQVKGDDGESLVERLYAFLDAQFADEDIGYAPLPVLKSIRHSITEASNARMRAWGAGRLSFDTAVPRNRFGEYLDTLAARLACAYPDVDLIAFGHAGVGGVHLHLTGHRGHPLAERAEELIALVFDVTMAHGGTFSAEHGVGPKWASEFGRRADPRLRERLRAEKRRRDPSGILNPRSFGLLG